MSREEREDRKERRERQEPKKIFDGCAVTKHICEGECKELHQKGCPEFYHFYLEPIWKTRKTTPDNPKPRRIIKGYRKVEIS